MALIGLALYVSAEQQSLITATADPPTRNIQVIYYDSAYLFVARDFGDHRDHRGNTTPGLFVHSKANGRWLQVIAVSTRGATFGKYDSPAMQMGGWDFTSEAAKPFAQVPLIPPGGYLIFPDRIEDDAGNEQYRLRFCSRQGIAGAESVLLISKADLAAAFASGSRRATQR